MGIFSGLEKLGLKKLDDLEVYESDDIVSLINKELVLNDINVYRISEATNTLEKDFFRMIGKSNDKTN